MAKRSAGVLVYRVDAAAEPEVLLVHPGGPFWARKDDGAWSIPKGEYDEGDDPLTVARREFEEEIGIPLPAGDVANLGTLKQPGGKIVTAFALFADVDVSALRSNTFEIEWPKGSRTMQTFPEVDRAGWFGIQEARTKLLKGQIAFLDALLDYISRTA